MISTNSVYQLPNDLPNNLRLLGNLRKSRNEKKSKNLVETQACVQFPLQKLIFDKSEKTYAKSDIKAFCSCPLFLIFLLFMKYCVTDFWLILKQKL